MKNKGEMLSTTAINSTSAVGTGYEDGFFSALPEIFENMPYRPEHCLFHRRKSYKSALKNRPINFENVVEVFRTEADLANNAQPTLVLIFECKNYNSVIEHDTINELNGRMQHILGAAKKGYLVTKKGFQSGAIQTAQSLGIGLIRYLPSGQSEFHANFQTTADEVDEVARNTEGLTNPDFHSTRGELGFFHYAGRFYIDIAPMIYHSVSHLCNEEKISMKVRKGAHL